MQEVDRPIPLTQEEYNELAGKQFAGCSADKLVEIANFLLHQANQQPEFTDPNIPFSTYDYFSWIANQLPNLKSSKAQEDLHQATENDPQYSMTLTVISASTLISAIDRTIYNFEEPITEQERDELTHIVFTNSLINPLNYSKNHKSPLVERLYTQAWQIAQRFLESRRIDEYDESEYWLISQSLFLQDRQTSSPEKEVFAAEVRDYLHGLIEDLPTDRQRQVYKLIYFNELKVSEVAHRLGISDSRVYEILKEGRKNLRISFLFNYTFSKSDLEEFL